MRNSESISKQFNLYTRASKCRIFQSSFISSVNQYCRTKNSEKNCCQLLDYYNAQNIENIRSKKWNYSSYTKKMMNRSRKERRLLLETIRIDDSSKVGSTDTNIK